MTEQLQSLPRPVLIAIVGGVAALALLFISRRGGEEEAVAPPAQTQAPAESSTAPGAESGTQSQAGSQAQQGKEGGAAAQANAREQRTLPSGVKRALDAKKVVVVMLYNPQSPDDRSVRQDVENISSRGGKVSTFTDKFDNVARYTRLTGTQAFTQTPAVVVVDPAGNGRMAVGFRDQATVDQMVVDALR
jgi:hypothetical protein